MTKTLWLKGLHLDGFPVSVLVAYGILRVLAEEQDAGGVQLLFADPFKYPVAGLLGIDRQQLINYLVNHLSKTPPLPQAVLQRQSLKESEDMLYSLTPSNPRARRFMSALYLVRKKESLLTPLDTSKGRQRLLNTLKKAWDLLSKLPLAHELDKVLFSDVLVLAGQKLLSKGEEEYGRVGWHPSQYRRWAERARDPEKEGFMKTVRIHPIAILLAWEAVPLFTLFHGTDGPMGAGVTEVESPNPSLVLPIPGEPITLEMLRALLYQAPLAIKSSRTSWPPEVAIWRSRRLGHPTKTDEPYPVFSAAELV
ncbi:hypothetical protein [Thermus tengchongensis]|uniref:hypothetical protein n=1 Tax=Thermus tengchongensis TaxID=1214928 RepID=UPI00163AF72D|nr:hypothetical protein [Thermus tengchongensis]